MTLGSSGPWPKSYRGPIGGGEDEVSPEAPTTEEAAQVSVDAAGVAIDAAIESAGASMDAEAAAERAEQAAEEAARVTENQSVELGLRILEAVSNMAGRMEALAASVQTLIETDRHVHEKAAEQEAAPQEPQAEPASPEAVEHVPATPGPAAKPSPGGRGRRRR